MQGFAWPVVQEIAAIWVRIVVAVTTNDYNRTNRNGRNNNANRKLHHDVEGYTFENLIWVNPYK